MGRLTVHAIHLSPNWRSIVEADFVFAGYQARDNFSIRAESAFSPRIEPDFPKPGRCVAEKPFDGHSPKPAVSETAERTSQSGNKAGR